MTTETTLALIEAERSREFLTPPPYEGGGWEGVLKDGVGPLLPPCGLPPTGEVAPTGEGVSKLIENRPKAAKTGHDQAQEETQEETQDEAPEENDSELTPAQDRVLIALLTTATLEHAAKKALVSPRTLRRWLGEPAFRRAYLSVRRQALEAATGSIQQLVAGAVAALERNLHCGVPGVELRAAQVILEQAARGVEMLEFEERLHALEQKG